MNVQNQGEKWKNWTMQETLAKWVNKILANKMSLWDMIGI